MKLAYLISLFIISTTVKAFDPVCTVKKKNLASLTLAQELGVEVQGVEVLSSDVGHRSQNTPSNFESEMIIVRAGNRNNRALTFKVYEVSGTQIGVTDDCKDLKVVEVAP